MGSSCPLMYTCIKNTASVYNQSPGSSSESHWCLYWKAKETRDQYPKVILKTRTLQKLEHCFLLSLCIQLSLKAHWICHAHPAWASFLSLLAHMTVIHRYTQNCASSLICQVFLCLFKLAQDDQWLSSTPCQLDNQTYPL